MRTHLCVFFCWFLLRSETNSHTHEQRALSCCFFFSFSSLPLHIYIYIRALSTRIHSIHQCGDGQIKKEMNRFSLEGMEGKTIGGGGGAPLVAFGICAVYRYLLNVSIQKPGTRMNQLYQVKVV